ncbi:hypothetical protein [Vibrio metschnikovii]|uniref:hypothetical protein n=1 Tax=Vibrio metschnikovii TaxID=28172 RepID=UPI001C30C5C0|nr:hypothetical protein [Vibrio metschnikovii]
MEISIFLTAALIVFGFIALILVFAFLSNCFFKLLDRFTAPYEYKRLTVRRNQLRKEIYKLNLLKKSLEKSLEEL